MRSRMMAVVRRGLTAAITGWCVVAPSARGQAVPSGPQGRVAGRITDKGTGRPLVSVRVRLVGRVGVVETDLDGRFRTPLVPVGKYNVAAALIGYRPAQLDSVAVKDGQTAVVSMALESSPVQLEELTVASDKPTRVSSAAGLLSAQQNAMAVVDGVSAEAIAKTPDSDAGQAVARVTGLAVVQNKVVVRGLAERYSTSLLNGVEIASPEPDRKFVPLDVFASGLLESIVAAKTATPDRPGDFAGGIVDVQTKEFPENFILSFGVSQGYNDRSTFRRFARGPRSGSDLFGFDGIGRGFSGAVAGQERFAESLRNVWTPGSAVARPNLGLNAAVGGRKDLGNDAFGYVLSVDYGNGRDYNPDRYDAEGNSPILFNESRERVELSGLMNLAYRSGAGHKFGFKNFYSRSSTEVFRSGIGGDTGEGPSLNYQGQFIAQYIQQSQVTGDHYLGNFLKSRLEWKGSFGQAGRDDLDNRQLRYVDKGSGYLINNSIPSYRYNTTLLDKSYTGQADWSIPFSLRGPQDGLFKVGASYRRKDREFGAAGYEMHVGTAISQDILSLGPEQLLAPENVGPGMITYQPASILVPYDAREEVKAGYLMSDFEILPSVRIVAGARMEQWTANLTEAKDTAGVITRDNRDILWSANLTYAMTSKINFRLAGYKTVARPDLRELSSGGYTSVVGGTVNIGNPDLRRSSILNADARFEVYPGADELLAVSLFYKRFTDPIITTYRYAGGIVILPDNGKVARSYGAEFEVRKNLGFLASGLSNVLANANLTLLSSEVQFRDVLGAGNVRPQFQGQSPYLVNTGLTYSGKLLSVSALFNRFGDRVERYPGIGSGSNSSNANVIEKARSTLDGKVKLAVRGGWSLSLTGKNLLNTRSEISYDKDVPGAVARPILGRTLDGVSVSMGISYAR